MRGRFATGAGSSRTCRTSITAGPGFSSGRISSVWRPALSIFTLADLPRHELLKAAGLFDGELELLLADADLDQAAAAAPAAADEQLDLERARLLAPRTQSWPSRPALVQIAERVLVRQRLVAELLAVDLGRAGGQRDRAVRGLRIGCVVRVGRHHLCADRLCRQSSSRLASSLDALRLLDRQIPRLAGVGLHVEQLAPAGLVELDQLPVAARIAPPGRLPWLL